MLRSVGLVVVGDLLCLDQGNLLSLVGFQIASRFSGLFLGAMLAPLILDFESCEIEISAVVMLDSVVDILDYLLDFLVNVCSWVLGDVCERV